jgi:hypothetical protein
MADWRRCVAVAASQATLSLPIINVSTAPHNNAPSIQPSFQAIHPLPTHDSIQSPHTQIVQLSLSLPPLFLFFAFVALCFSILSPFVQRLSIIFGCSVRALGNPCITSQRSPCDKYNAPLSFFIPMRILASSVSLPPFVTDGTRDGGDGSMMR